jgi:hypothetical protein
LVEIGEVDEAGGYQWVIRAERLLADRECLLQKRLCLGKALLRFMERAEPGERGRVLRIFLAVALARKGDIALGKWHCCRDLVLAVKPLDLVVQPVEVIAALGSCGASHRPGGNERRKQKQNHRRRGRKALPHLQWSSLM